MASASELLDALDGPQAGTLPSDLYDGPATAGAGPAPQPPPVEGEGVTYSQRVAAQANSAAAALALFHSPVMGSLVRAA